MRDALTERDSAHRAAALDVTQSFLVQAPAGSGKTELLIQRYLALLARVARPERVVAMTFTRKAAGEMRERIIAALGAAAAKDPVDDAPHARLTRELADNALARDRELGWHLVAHPAQLQVHTIDALCTAIARQAPLATGLGATPRLEERSAPLYRDAVRTALTAARADDPAWQRVLSHLDNDGAAAVELLGGLLGKREQWLKHWVGRDPGALREELEAALVTEIESELAVLRELFPRALVPELAALMRYAAANLALDVRHARRAERMAKWVEAGRLPPAKAAAVNDWKMIADGLLTLAAPQWRRQWSIDEGFPPKGNGIDAISREAHKQRIAELVGGCAAVPGLCEALHAARRLPPASYDDAAWSVVEALLELLPRLAAQLKVTFAETGRIDFPEATLAALAALGEPDSPSDLLLRIDFRLEHLLVDEFQDTSDVQNALIERLTAGWEAGASNTLFAVGDPMQSVYRFRDAEVRLFLDAQRMKRIGNVAVQFIDLARNFRSQGGIVDWVNHVFPQVLAARDDPWRSAVAYAPAVPARPALSGIAPTVDVFASAHDEAAAVIARVQAALRDGADSVAILVRARSHLDDLLPALHGAGIAFAAVELEALADRQAMLDLLALTHALIQPADRLAWLALLRAPWCGMMLPDLFAIAQAADESDWPQAIASLPLREELSSDGAVRLARLASVLTPALAARGRASLVSRVRGAWLALGGPACVDDPLDLDAAERFFALLAAHEEAGEIGDYDAFRDALAELKAAPEDAAETRVQVMTLHRAKGLEFDTVILPGLARATIRGAPGLLRWRMRPQGLLLAPAKVRGGREDPMYGYLGMLDADEEDAELARLLYVGCTRARTRLHLTASLPVVESDGALAWKAPPPGSALGKLWNALDIPPPPQDAGAAAAERTAMPPLLARLPLAFRPVDPVASVPLATSAFAHERAVREFAWAHITTAAVGTVAHRLLAQVGGEGLAAWNAERVAAARPRIERELASEGVAAAAVPAAIDGVIAVVTRVLADARGRWLFDPAHDDAASERALAGQDEGGLVHVTLDRTFVASGVRWIVDFKTGRHEGGNVAVFLDSEVERYRGQLERYARIMCALDARSRTVRVALYYPLVEGGWREWDVAC